MTIFRTLDDALIDRLFQPIVNRLQVSRVAHVAIPNHCTQRDACHGLPSASTRPVPIVPRRGHDPGEATRKETNADDKRDD